MLFPCNTARIPFRVQVPRPSLGRVAPPPKKNAGPALEIFLFSILDEREIREPLPHLSAGVLSLVFPNVHVERSARYVTVERFSTVTEPDHPDH